MIAATDAMPQLPPGTNLALSLMSSDSHEVDACRGVIHAQRQDRATRATLPRALPSLTCAPAGSRPEGRS
jgi:hypothetical protein